MDEIFGEENFVQQLIWQKKKGSGQNSNDFAKEHEYILAFKKKNWKINEEKVDYEEKKFNKIINGKKAKIIKLEKWGCGSIPKTNSLVKPFKDPEGQDFYPIAPNGQPGTWRKNPFKKEKKGEN